MYIPANMNEMNFEAYTVGSGSTAKTFTVAQQKEAFEQFINNSPYLSKHRGQFAERSSALTPWFNRIDVRFLQDVFVATGKDQKRNTLQFSADITNFSNLLNKDWGTTQRYILNNPLTFRSINAANQPVYRLQNLSNELVTTPFQDVISPSSTYKIQLGLRYTF
jgi:hypothetical protein